MLGAHRPPRPLAALAVHIFTACGAAAAVLALAAAIERDFPACFAWLGVALVIDGVDGTMARALDVERNAPWIEGATLDLVVDFLTYVIVPLIALWRAELLPPAIALPLCALVAAASALYFGDRRMKTADNWFRGFPALWNVAALYLFVFPLPGAANAAIVVALAGLMFAPIAFSHPLRVDAFRVSTIGVTGVWLASAVAAILQRLDADAVSRAGLLAGALWFVFLSVWRSPRGL